MVELAEAPLRPLDRALRWIRIQKVKPYIPRGARVLDVGCGDGALFERLRGRIGSGVGIDPAITTPTGDDRFRFLTGAFPDVGSLDDGFDVITMLAVLEHVDADELEGWRTACARLLRPGGCVVATVPERPSIASCTC